MNNFEIIKGQGGVPKALPNKDHVSGIIAYYTTEVANKYAEVKVFETNDSAQDSFAGVAGFEILQYHIREYFKMQPAGRLWVMVKTVGTDMGSAIKELQEKAEGEIRQIAVWNGDKSASVITPGDFGKLQTAATELEAKGTPVSIVYAGDYDAGSAYRQSGNCNVSFVIGEEVSAEVTELTGAGHVVSAVGACLGCMSLASVNESIAWVAKFNLGYDKVKILGENPDKTGLDGKGFLFLVKYDGVAGAYWNDSHTMDVATSDYSTIESMRAIDKACRGVRTYLLPYLASPVYLNDDGTMRADSLANLKNVAGQALEAMERAGELSGYEVEIDAKQNILANSTVEFVIKNVAVGVMRNIKIKIGYVTNL
jgi:hypothetical protein